MSFKVDRQGFIIFLKGVAMGAADAIPGVSGGTIALILGIYERLVDAIASISIEGPKLVGITLGDGTNRRVEMYRLLERVDLPFLLVLGIGILSGVAAIATVIDVALSTYRAITFAVFFGIILASPLVLRDEVAFTPLPLTAGALGALIAYVIGGLPTRHAEYSLPVLFLIGAVAICAMVLPGISGSLVLVIVGAYDTMTGAIGGLVRVMVRGGEISGAIEHFTVLLVFSMGALVGLLSFARVVSWAIEANREITMTFLVGIMLGALRSPYIEITENVTTYSLYTVTSLSAGIVFGVIIILVLNGFNERV